jgi:KUP system potassium uptake protein
MSLGYLPRLRIVHTSAKAMGQIYVPAINWLLLASVLTLVLTFKSSVALAFAYGTGVTATITITTLLFLYVAARRWSVPRWLVIAGGGALVSIEVLFLAANLTKIGHGAWLPLLIGLVAFTVMTTWQRGRAIVAERREHEEGSLRTFIDELHARELPVERVPGTAVFLNRTKVTAPLAMREIVEHLHALSEHVVILSIDVLPVPHIPPDERLVIDDLGYTDDGISHVGARFGYMDPQAVPAVLALIDPEQLEFSIDVGDTSFYLSAVDLVRGDEPGFNRWRRSLFLATSRLTSDAAEYFHLPREKTVIVGSRIEI